MSSAADADRADSEPVRRSASLDRPDGSDDKERGATSTIGAQSEVERRALFSMDAVSGRVDWPKYVAQLGEWKQGHLITDIKLTWMAPPGVDVVTGYEQEEDEIVPAWLEDNVSAIICSQTCDIGAGPPGNKHPFVLVAPLLHEDGLGDKPRKKLAREGKLQYLVAVLPPPNAAPVESATTTAEATMGSTSPTPSDPASAAPRAERWYADLRLLVPVSKALLLGRTPTAGFASEGESLMFAETLAQKFRRPALHEALSEELPELVNEFVRTTGSSKQCFVKVEQIRLDIVAGDRLNPQRGQLIALTNNGELSDSEQEQWNGLNAKAAACFKRHGIEYAPLVHYDVNTIRAAAYRRTVPVRCDLLGRIRFP